LKLPFEIHKYSSELPSEGWSGPSFAEDIFLSVNIKCSYDTVVHVISKQAYSILITVYQYYNAL